MPGGPPRRTAPPASHERTAPPMTTALLSVVPDPHICSRCQHRAVRNETLCGVCLQPEYAPELRERLKRLAPVLVRQGETMPDLVELTGAWLGAWGPHLGPAERDLHCVLWALAVHDPTRTWGLLCDVADAVAEAEEWRESDGCQETCDLRGVTARIGLACKSCAAAPQEQVADTVANLARYASDVLGTDALRLLAAP